MTAQARERVRALRAEHHERAEQHTADARQLVGLLPPAHDGTRDELCILAEAQVSATLALSSNVAALNATLRLIDDTLGELDATVHNVGQAASR